MDFTKNLKAFLRSLPLKKMSGHQKFLAMAIRLCHGKEGTEIDTAEIRNQWLKSLLNGRYYPIFYDRAQREGWVNSRSKGKFVVTESGLENIGSLVPDSNLNAGDIRQSGSLVIVSKKGTHTFDKFLRNIFAKTKKHAFIADSWVDGTIFDNALDVIPKNTTIKLLYAHSTDNFEQRAKRFAGEYQRFTSRKYKSLHDRFLVVDDMGYVLGPSIKDAAMNAPALVVILSVKEKRLLHSFFEELWLKAK